ncbi:MAG: PLDc N-terminal domain-containing protein [Actinomycetota bacterium]|nr:PLDc N-terminal domain-containing protein [Actinomycetota bacterium]MDH5225431.1 PLDc N-terminal domain-containing protein [Actinomycetota bacterium]
METATCYVCRSVNHAGALRCLNCGSPMTLPSLPEGMEMDDLPPMPSTPPVAAGWNAVVAQGSQTRPLTASAIVAAFLVVGLIIAFAVVMFFVPLQTPIPGVGGAEVTLAGLLGPVVTSILVAILLFQVWMLIDVVLSGADMGTKVLWVLLILFLGLLGAVAYAMIGRSRRRSRF